MKKFLSGSFLPLLLAAVLLHSCKKDDTVTPAPAVDTTPKGAYILSEGGFGGNNTKLSFYNSETAAVTGDFFLQQNPGITAGLGGLGNDMIIYGSKLYIVMNVSQNVTVLNASNATLITKINFTGATKQPRYAAAARGKVYVTAYDGTVNVIDTASLTIVKTINVGPNPEGIAASADYLYVANSGGFNPVPDSTVSLIDLSTETEIRKIKVGVNPNKVEVTANGKVYVSAYGNFTTIPASVSLVNTATNLTSTNLGSAFQYSHVRASGNTVYMYNNYGGAGTAKVYDAVANAIVRNEFITDGTAIITPYGVNVDELTGDVYISDAIDYTASGKVYCFSSAGVKKFSISVAPGVNPNKVIFKR